MQVTTMAYAAGEAADRDFPLSAVSDELERPETVLWVDLLAPAQEDLAALGQELGLHELAVEDAMERHRRPKVIRYPDHLFLAIPVIVSVGPGHRLEWTEIDAFLSERWLVTVRKDDRLPMAAVEERWDRSPELSVYGSRFLLYGLLDVVIDRVLDTVAVLDDPLEAISDRVASGRAMDPQAQRRLFEVRKALGQVHRFVVPMREMMAGLMRPQGPGFLPEMVPYYQDVYENLMWLSDSTDFQRDQVNTLVESNLALREYRQNQIMKKVTSWAAIIAVPTLVTGYFGMNVPYPGYGDPFGVVVSLILILSPSLALYILFRRIDWL